MIYNISRHLVVALINNDFSGLSKEDEQSANQWDAEQGDMTIEILNEDTSFERCDLCGLFADCLEIEIHKR